MYHYSELKGNIIYRIDVGCKWDAELIWNNEFKTINPFAPGDFAEKRVLKLVEWFSGHCRARKS